MNPYLLEVMAREKHQHFQEEMDRYRMRKLARNRKPGLVSRFLAGAGRILIDLGTKMQKQSTTVSCSTPDPNSL